MITAVASAPHPKYEIALAFVDEKSATSSTSEIGLSDHHGRAPDPPGFESNAKLGPPPAIAKPGSRKILFGSSRTENDHGMLANSGAKTSVARRAKR